MYLQLKNNIIKSLKNRIEELNYPTIEDIRLDEPPKPEMGDLSSNVSFQLAKELKRSPMEITQEILENLETPQYIKRIESKGPYINYYINYAQYSTQLLEHITTNYGELKPQQKEQIILEHTSANPNGPLHIGHLRNAIIGDSLARVLRKAGHTVETQYYVNDMGRQIAMVVWGIENLEMPIDGKEKKKDHQIGELYHQVYLKTQDENTNTTQEIDTLIKTYENKATPLDTEFEHAINTCLDGMKETLTRLGITHNKFTWEGQFVRNGQVDKIVDTLEESGNTIFDEVLRLNLEPYGIDKALVLRRSDGTSLYSTRDLAYHQYKAENSTVSIDILGSDHQLAVEQISIALEIIGSQRPEVILYEFIDLPEGSMSTRRGVFISVDQLMDEAEQRAREEIQKRRNDLKPEEIDEIAEIIGIGAIRYFIAKISPEKKITFKWEEVLNFERGCAAIQYAHARAYQLLQKAPKTTTITDTEWTPTNEEIELIRTLSRFPEIIQESAKTRRIHNIAQYAQDLANSFNKFYKATPVIGSPHENLRLNIVEKSKITIANCLDVLGIQSPNYM